MGGTTTSKPVGTPTERRIPYGKVDPRLSGLWTSVGSEDEGPSIFRLSLDKNGSFLLVTRVFDSPKSVITTKNIGTWGRFSDYVVLRCFKVYYGFGSKDREWIDYTQDLHLTVINVASLFFKGTTMTQREDRDSGFVGSWKTKDDLVQITLIDTGEFQYDINHGDGTLSRKRGEWYPHHAVKGVVLNTNEKKLIMGLPVIESPKSPTARPKKRGTLSDSDSDSDSSSGSGSSSTEDQDAITIHLNDKKASTDSSEDSWDGKGKGKEKERLNPKKAERHLRFSEPTTVSLQTQKGKTKWTGSNEIYLLEETSAPRNSGKPPVLHLFSDLEPDEETKAKTKIELGPFFPTILPSILKKEAREQLRNSRLSKQGTYSPYAIEIRQLAEMGFSGGEVPTLLAQYDGNVQAVVNRLLS